MPKVKYKTSEVEPGQNFDQPFPKGLYPFTVDSIEFTKSKKDDEPMLAIILEVAKGDHKSRKVWEYIKLDGSQDFRLRQFVDAIGAKQDGEFDYNKDTLMVKSMGGVKIASMKLEAHVKIEPGDDEYGPSNKIKNFIAKEDAEDTGEEVEEPEDEGEEEGGEPEDDAGSGNTDDDDWSWDDLKDMTHEELSSTIAEWEADTDPDEYEDDEEGTTNLAKALAEEYSIEVPKAKKSKSKKSKAKKKETPDYSEMDLAELKEACEEKELSPKGTKKVLLKRLEKAATSGGDNNGDPF